MALPIGFNDLAKLTLLASDASYFDTDLRGSWLTYLRDTAYGIDPQYSVPQEYKAIDQWVDPSTGLGVIVYKKIGATPANTEIIIAMRGTDGPNPQDWVSNSQYLGWNQWNSPDGRTRVFNIIDSLKSDPLDATIAFEGKVHFTGQSLGGGLAQYAAYEYVQSHQNLAGFSKANITLTTFNSFGGVLGLQQNLGNYSSSVLANIGSNAHFYTEGDLVSRLGSLNGVGHTGGTTYMLNAHASKIDPDTGEPFLLNAIDAHRIETGFYPFLLPGVEFEAAVARSIEYLPMQNVQRIAALYGRIANDQDVSPLESGPRLAAGIIAGLALGDPKESNALIQAVLTNLHSAGQVSDEWYDALRKYDWGAIAQDTALVLPGATGAAYGVALLAAVLSDALEFQVDRHAQLFNNIRDWVSGAVPTVEQGVRTVDRRLQGEMLLALVPGAVIGSKLASVLQPLGLDINEFAQTLATSGSNWLHEALTLVRDKGNLAGQNIAAFSTQLASAVTEVALGIGASPATLQAYLTTTLVPFVRDTAQGIGNAVNGYLQDVAGAFDLGRALNFNDVNLIAQAYAAELSDPRLAAPIRTALEEAQAIVQHAGQTVVVQQGIGVNPFTTPGFNPAAAPLATGTVREDGANVFTAYLPYVAGAGGQRIRLTLNGLGSNSVTVLSGGQELIPQNGMVTLVMPEGQQQLFFTLRAADVSANTVVSLAAVLVNGGGTATHVEHPEATVSLVDNAINYDNGRPTMDISSFVPGPGTWNPDLDQDHNYFYGAPEGGGSTIATRSGNDQIYGSNGVNFITGGNGHDRIYGGGGGDILLGGNYFLIQHDGIFPFEEADGNDVLDGQAGDDTIEGRGNDDRIYGGEGNDRLYGDASELMIGAYGRPPEGDDLVEGGAGDDYLWGDYGADILLGGADSDVLVGDYLFHTQYAGNTGYSDFLFDQTRAKDDFLDGGEGADTLFGDGGNDTLVGGVGDDVLYGDYGAGTFVAAGQFNPADGDLTNIAGNDVLNGGGDNDYLYGMGGDDVISGGEGIDVIFGDFAKTIWPTATVFGNDVIDAGAGDDRASGGSGNDTLFGGTGNDRLWGDMSFLIEPTAVGHDLLDGGAGDDILFGGRGNDRLEGGDGHDILIGTDHYEWNLADQDVLAGGAGDDRLYGQGGDDVLSGGVGTDILFGDDYYVADQVPGPNAIGPGLLQGLAYSSASGNDVLDGGADDDVLSGGAGNDTLIGGSGNDYLYGDSGQAGIGGNDRLAGGLGNDVLDGGEGNDIYEFNLGDGTDDVFDSGQSHDTIQFGSGISSSSVSLTTDSGRIFVKVGDGPDGVILGGVGDVFGSKTIEQFQFADGTTLTYADLIARGFNIVGTGNHDVLFGTDLTNRLRGGLGNDTLFGGLSEDTYFFNSGDGVDLIVDSSTPDGKNRVVFGPGITPAMLTISVADDPDHGQANVLEIRPGTGADAIQLKNLDRKDVFGPHAVDSFQFADGSRLSYQELLSRGFDLVGTADSDLVLGTNITDRITAWEGDDQVRSGAGDDLLDGGAGDDQLRGESGNDTYVFGAGSGHDRILDEQGVADVVRIAPGIVPRDITMTRSGDDLVLRLNQGADQLTIDYYFLLPIFRIEKIEFSDGSILSSSFLDRPVIEGTEQNDVLTGTVGDDVLVGLGGNDQISGLAGNDLLNGNAGADVLRGGTGHDTFVIDESGDLAIEEMNEGTDTVQSSISYTLGANLENLMLVDPSTGSGQVNGTGNALDNVLTGSSAANVLSGGEGNDTYVIGTGDTVVELAGEGTDRVQTGVNMTLGANVENLTLTGSASLIGTGNELDNVLQAEGSISILAGGDGNDTYMVGPNGDDDILVETASGGIDTVIAGHDFRLPAHIENLTLLDPKVPDFATFSLIPYVPFALFGWSVTGVGNDLANGLIGGRANNLLDGGLGADTLAGGAGNDLYIVDNSHDVVTELVNDGTDTIHSSVTYTLSAHVENLTLTGTAPANGAGNELNNDVRGNDASNVLDGGAGTDSLQGGGGADTYRFGHGSGRDMVFDVSADGEVDTIELAADVAPTEVEVYRRDYDLILVLTGTTDELTLAGFFSGPEYAQKLVRFADGTLWTDAELQARARDGGPLIGTPGDDRLSGGAGHRALIGNAGNDVLTGGALDDLLYGDAQLPGLQVSGDDTLIGGAGDDLLIDFRGTNLFDGGAGNDSLTLGSGIDTVLFGRGSGIDSVALDNTRNDVDIIQMAEGISPADVVMTRRSSALSHIVDLRILDSGDQVSVVLSTDYFAVGPETTQARVRFADRTQWNLAWAAPDLPFTETPPGSSGDTTYSVSVGNEPIVELPGEGIDTVQSAVDYRLPANIENLFLTDNFTNVGSLADNATGNELDNFIVGNTRDNVLAGGAGNDVLVGGLFRSFEGGFFLVGTGRDILIGGEGDDMLMADGGNITFAGPFGNGSGGDFEEDVPRQADDLFIGGLGNDTYILHSQQQTVTEFSHEGTDTVRSTVDYFLGENVENLTLLENPVYVLPGPLVGRGNELDNVLIGNSEDNVLSGESGHDTLWGGRGLYRDSETMQSGSDLLIGGAGHDTYLFKVGDGIDRIQDVAAVGEGNRVQFGQGITRTDLTFTHDQTSRILIIQVGSNGTDQLLLTDFDPTGTNGSLVASTLAFADGSVLNFADLFPLNHAPTVATPLTDQTVSEGAPFNIQVPDATFTDQDAGDTPTYSASLADGRPLPAWVHFDAATATFSGIPDDAQVGLLDIRVTATDQEQLTVSDVFTLTVSNVNEAPTVAAPLGNQAAVEDTAFTFVVPGSTFADVDQVHGDTWSYSATLAGRAPLPSWFSFDPISHMFSGTPLNNDVGTLDITVTATDSGTLSTSTSFTLAVQNVNDAPTVAAPLADQQTTQGTVFNLVVPAGTFADVDAGDTLIYSAQLATGAALPTWLSFNPITSTFAGTPQAGDVGTIDVRVTATDQGALTAVDVFALTITPSGGTAGNDTLVGTSGQDLLDGLAGDDVLRGLAGNDALIGGSGNDLLDGGAGSDTMVGGLGNDTYVVDAAGDSVTENANEGTDTVQSSLAFTLGANVENLTLTGTAAINGTGNALDNVLTGNSGANTLAGSAGNDTYVVSTGDTVVESANAGLDTVQSDVTWILGANLDALILTGNANINGTGNALNNLLTGNSGANVLTGGAGNDVYVIGMGDTVVEGAGAGTDTVLSEVTTTLSANVELLGLTGTAAINGTGNSLANGITGNGAANVLDGGTGADILAGLAGDDMYVVDHIGDLVIELANNGVDQVQSSVTMTLAANVEHLTLTGAAGINGTGNTLDNVLTGNNAANVLSGANGNDTLRGGVGNDTVNGGSGNDMFLFGRGDGQDLVQDNSGTADKVLYDGGINPFDLVISRQANDLRLTIHGSSDRITVQNWYLGTTNQIETIQASNGQTLFNTQVDRLIQAMAGFSAQTGLTWDQAIDQRPQEVQAVLAASWQ